MTRTNHRTNEHESDGNGPQRTASQPPSKRPVAGSNPAGDATDSRTNRLIPEPPLCDLRSDSSQTSSQSGGQRLFWPDVDHAEVQAGWQPLADIPKGGGITANDVLDVLANRHDEGGWNGRPGRWVFLREVQAATGSYSDVQRFDGLALGLVPSNKYARIVYEVKVSRSDWLRELKPKTILKYDGRLRVSPDVAIAARGNPDAEQRLKDLGYTLEERPKWASAMEIATEFWYAAPVRCILPDELPEGAGLLEVRPWGRDGELRARVVIAAQRRDTPNPGPEFWASALRSVAGRRRA